MTRVDAGVVGSTDCSIESHLAAGLRCEDVAGVAAVDV